MRGLNILLLVVNSIILSSCLSKTDSKGGSDRPNIIVIMSDDMGFSDIGCYGGAVKTPVLDGLAEDGLRFTQFYNAARCCPTRGSILTGLYPHQAGIGCMMEDRGFDGYRGDLSKNAVTIAEVLKRSGYSTYISGKWHVTPYHGVDKEVDKSNWPLQRGFDKFFGTIHGAGSFFDPNSLTRDNEHIAPSEDFYYTDAISDNAVKFIEEQDSDKPFFIYLPYTAAHWPMQAKQEDIDKYRGKFDEGWDVLRAAKLKRLIDMGIVNPNLNLSDKGDIPDWEDAELKEWQSSLMEVYAAMIDCMDQGIGRVMGALESKGIEDNTLVIFLQDNGGCAEQYGLIDNIEPHASDIDPDSIEPMKEGELQTRMVPRYTRDGKPVMVGKGLVPGAADTFLAYGEPWANASNAPFRMYKHWVHEGGISTPLIVHWPDGIKYKNEFRTEPGHIIDIMATCIDVAGAEYPKEFKGNKITPLEGKSLVPIFNKEKMEDRALFWEHEGNKAVRIGEYKLVSKWSKESDYNWELYNIEEDRVEMNNLASSMPERVLEMESIWKDWARRSDVLTWRTFQPIE